MDILLNVLRIIFSLFMGIVLYITITILIIGTTFVLREALLYFFNIDLYEKMKSWVPKPKPKVKKNVVLNEDSDIEWLKNRGRY